MNQAPVIRPIIRPAAGICTSALFNESDEYMAIIEQVTEIVEKYYQLEEVNYDVEFEKALKG